MKNAAQKIKLPTKLVPWGLLLTFLASGCATVATAPSVADSEPSPATSPPPSAAAIALSETCASITTPLSEKEQNYAQIAWNYFGNNRRPQTGFVNATDGYPSGTLWDQGNYLTALNAALHLGLIEQAEFDQHLTQFLTTLANLSLFEGKLPHKVYNSATGEIVDYANEPTDRGLGWSALDIGRMLTALHITRSCHPEYGNSIEEIVASWALEDSVKDGQLYGAIVLSNGETQPVQEGRLGYEEYAARGYELWGYEVSKALELEPMKTVTVEGTEITVDSRDYKETNGSNYVVSESYILESIEFGLSDELKKVARQLLSVQEKRYERTGELTAVSEDNINKPPHFLYNTLYANGTPWAVITGENEPFTDLRTMSTKAAFGWRYLFPEDDYAQKLYEAVNELHQPEKGGFYAGLYEKSDQPNDILTGNTNSLILEILYYKARGNQPIIP
ncbi:MAG: DUF3131 domain-containing protein [Cyanobacteria bacterium P01_D01_bin.105]